MNIKTKQKLFLQDYEYLKDALKNYNPSLLDNNPNDIKTMYSYYTYIDDVYTWLRCAYDEDLPVLCNEMRAILGHISEYDSTNDVKKKNLDKAYSHLRRLGIDNLKILCNGLDQNFDEWIQKYAKFDFRNIDNTFLPEYIKLYHEAHDSYLEVQQAENLGSDRDNCIIEKYHRVALKYLQLFEHHIQDRRARIERTAFLFRLNTCLCTLATVFFTLISVFDVIKIYL